MRWVVCLALLPSKQKSKNKKIINKVLNDKNLEIEEGCDGMVHTSFN